MFDIGWTEMMVIAVLAIIVIGPKDLPGMLRTVGKWTGRARALAREFQSSLDEVAREAELDEIKKGVEQVTSFDIKGEIENSIDPSGTLDGAFDFDETEKLKAQAEAQINGEAKPDPDSGSEATEDEVAARRAEWAAAAAPPHSLQSAAGSTQPDDGDSADQPPSPAVATAKPGS